jgi:hypothetical protein
MSFSNGLNSEHQHILILNDCLLFSVVKVWECGLKRCNELKLNALYQRLIDWCLTPTLAIFQLYHGATPKRIKQIFPYGIHLYII